MTPSTVNAMTGGSPNLTMTSGKSAALQLIMEPGIVIASATGNGKSARANIGRATIAPTNRVGGTPINNPSKNSTTTGPGTFGSLQSTGTIGKSAQSPLWKSHRQEMCPTSATRTGPGRTAPKCITGSPAQNTPRSGAAGGTPLGWMKTGLTTPGSPAKKWTRGSRAEAKSTIGCIL